MNREFSCGISCDYIADSKRLVIQFRLASNDVVGRCCGAEASAAEQPASLIEGAPITFPGLPC
jgi:hypothetical protein